MTAPMPEDSRRPAASAASSMGPELMVNSRCTTGSSIYIFKRARIKFSFKRRCILCELLTIDLQLSTFSGRPGQDHDVCPLNGCGRIGFDTEHAAPALEPRVAGRHVD